MKKILSLILFSFSLLSCAHLNQYLAEYKSEEEIKKEAEEREINFYKKQREERQAQEAKEREERIAFYKKQREERQKQEKAEELALFNERQAIKAKEEEARKNKRAKKKALEDRFNLKFCDHEGLLYYAAKGIPLKSNCMVRADKLKVMQKIKDGILVSFDAYGTIYFIINNAKDENLVDGERLEKGYYKREGEFQYTTVLGTVKTVVKLKRLNLN